MRICGGYYTVVRRYEYYFQVVKTHTFFTHYIFFHIFTSENMENTNSLVYGKTPITI